METKYRKSGYVNREYCKAQDLFIKGHKTRECKLCHNKAARDWRKLNPMTKEQRKKDNCRSYAGVYLRRGKIKKMNCIKCGNVNSEMHHYNYDKPLDIVWLCRTCHMAEHRKEG